MAAAAPIAGIASVASLGLGAMSTIEKGQGTQAADQFQADRAQRAAQFGEVQAAMTDTTMRENLNTTLGNIDVIRAAANIDPSSPTTAAILQHNEDLADRQRIARVSSIKEQDQEDLASAAYLRQAGDFAVTQSYLGAGADVLGGLAKSTLFPG